MAYNSRNKLENIIDVQELVLKETKRGATQKWVWETYFAIAPYRMSYSTFNNYLGRNAKRELAILEREAAEKKRQLSLEFS